MKESRRGENVNADLLEKATNPEIEAGRMSPDHKLRQLALVGTQFGIGTTAAPGQQNAARARGSWWRKFLNR